MRASHLLCRLWLPAGEPLLRSRHIDFHPSRLLLQSQPPLGVSRPPPGPQPLKSVELSSSWGFPRAGRWPEGPRTEFWRLSQTDTIPYMLAIYTLHFWAPAAPGTPWATRLAWLPAWLSGWPGCLAAWLPGWHGCLAGPGCLAVVVLVLPLRRSLGRGLQN